MGTASRLVETLNDLIQLDYDAVRAYEQAIAKVNDPNIRQDLQAFRDDHQRHVRDLGECVRQVGGIPKEMGRSLKGVLVEGLLALGSVTGTEGALKAMRMNEQLANRSYDEALKQLMSPDVREVVERIRQDERRHLETIEMHLARLNRGVAAQPYQHP